MSSATPSQRVRVVIVGGGPAGVATARSLRKFAPELADATILLERAPGRRNKLCGGGVTGACMKELGLLDLELRIPAVPIKRAVFAYGDIKRAFEFATESVVVRRDVFDDDLLAQVEKDVAVHRGERLRGLCRDADHLVVETNLTTYHADLVVGADGVGSMVRRFLFGELHRKLEPVTRLYQADLTEPVREEEAGTMTFDFSVLNSGVHGYFWVFPSEVSDRSVINTGVMHLPPYGSTNVMDVFRQTLQQYGYRTAPDARIRCYPELAYHPRRPIAGGNILLVGDAAGIEPLTGEGLAQCFAYGSHAGRFAKEQLDQSNTQMTSFRKRIARSTVGREMRMARWIAGRIYGSNWRFWVDLFLKRSRVGELLLQQTQGLDHLHKHLPLFHWYYIAHKLGWHGGGGSSS